MSFLAPYIDAGLSIPADTSPASLSAEEVARLQHQLAVVSAVLVWPRRLGGDATDEELARDKKYARRVVHVLNQSLVAWSSAGMIATRDIALPSDAEIQQEAAILYWPNWFELQLTYLGKRVALIATWAMNGGGDARWGKSAVVRLKNESNWIAYARR